ncbi:MAG: MerR family transcriptional regulator [Lawsonibacter sp.]|nr:MerR family transcriptional regulator [Lawsonibacter sp.]
MKINEVAKLSGVTVRTLHYYDEIGLLKPSEITEAGYRLYDSTALETLQQILFFRELDFSLNDIKEIMRNPNYDKANALTKHRELLLQKRNRIDDLIVLVDNTLKGEYDMSFKQFDMTEFEATKKKYAAEVKERWGSTAAYNESEKKTSSYDDNQWKVLSGEGEAILQEFGENRNIQPERKEAQALVKKWQDYITANFYNCTKEILSCLGLMYIGDERFTQNIDQNGTGTAAFMAAAIEIYCRK